MYQGDDLLEVRYVYFKPYWLCAHAHMLALLLLLAVWLLGDKYPRPSNPILSGATPVIFSCGDAAAQIISLTVRFAHFALELSFGVWRDVHDTLTVLVVYDPLR